jgi:hypothetical protein
MFDPGSTVTVKSLMPPGHVRAPVYVRGKTGQIERAIAPFANPEKLAYGLNAEPRMLYRVRFSALELWGPEAETPEDWIEAELYEHWIKTGDTADAS